MMVTSLLSELLPLHCDWSKCKVSIPGFLATAAPKVESAPLSLRPLSRISLPDPGVRLCWALSSAPSWWMNWIIRLWIQPAPPGQFSIFEPKHLKTSLLVCDEESSQPRDLSQSRFRGSPTPHLLPPAAALYGIDSISTSILCRHLTTPCHLPACEFEVHLFLPAFCVPQRATLNSVVDADHSAALLPRKNASLQPHSPCV